MYYLGERYSPIIVSQILNDLFDWVSAQFYESLSTFLSKRKKKKKKKDTQPTQVTQLKTWNAMNDPPQVSAVQIATQKQT